jgi:signal peptidase I
LDVRRKILGTWNEVWLVRFIFDMLFVILPVAFLIRTFGFGLYQVPTGSMETTLLVGERFFADKASYWFRKPRHGEIISFDDPTYPYSKNKAVKLFQTYVSWNVPNWTKRIIGLPGDTIKGVIEEGRPVVYRNGVKLDESAYVNKNPLIMLWHKLPYEQSRADYSEEARFDSRTFVPDIPWDKQPFYSIDPHLIVLNPETGQPESIRYPGTPHWGGKDIFEVHLKDNQYWVMGDNRLGSSDSREWGPLDGSLIHGKIIFRIWSIDSNEPWVIKDLLKHPIAFWSKIRWRRCAQVVY